MGTALDAGLIVTAIIIPVLLVLANLVLLSKYIDPEQAAGHYLSKFVLVGGGSGSPYCLLPDWRLWIFFRTTVDRGACASRSLWVWGRSLLNSSPSPR